MASVEAKKCDQCGTVEHGDQLASWIGLAKPNGVMLIGPIEEVSITVTQIYAAVEAERRVVKELCSQGCLHEMISANLQKGDQGERYGRRRSVGLIMDEAVGVA